jgi:hypothetical protein
MFVFSVVNSLVELQDSFQYGHLSTLLDTAPFRKIPTFCIYLLFPLVGLTLSPSNIGFRAL